jgi:hypothetical protein
MAASVAPSGSSAVSSVADGGRGFSRTKSGGARSVVTVGGCHAWSSKGSFSGGQVVPSLKQGTSNNLSPSLKQD